MKSKTNLLKRYWPTLLITFLIITYLSGTYYFKETTPKYTSDYLEIKAIKADNAFADKLGKNLDTFYEKVSDKTGYTIKKPIPVEIMDSKRRYYKNIIELKPRWSSTFRHFNSAESRRIIMISPNADDIESMASWYTDDIVIEWSEQSLVQHVLNVNDFSFDKKPMWLTEGISKYLSTQTESEKKALSETIKRSPIPDFNILSIDHNREFAYAPGRTDLFTDNNGRFFSATIIQMIDEEMGFETVMNIYNDYENYLDYLDFLTIKTEEEFLNYWEDYLMKEYKQ